MRSLVALIWCAALIAPASGACKDDVATAFGKQRSAPAFRMVADLAGDAGPTQMTVDYVPPDRMYQRVTSPGAPAAMETIAIGKWAWGTMGGGWEELQPQFAQSVTAHVRQTLVDPPAGTGDFECLGKQTYNGLEVLAYRSIEKPADGAPPAGQADAQLARTVFVDPATGLPVGNVVANVMTADSAPVFKATYTYAEPIKIEAPIGDPR